MLSVVQVCLAVGIDAKLQSLDDLILCIAVNLGLATLSSLPIVFIVNSLINKSIEYEAEQQDLKVNFERLIESVDLNYDINQPLTTLQGRSEVDEMPL